MPCTLDKGSLVRQSKILVSGANGFLGSHIVDEPLRNGYKVRGTVRNMQANKWLQDYFDRKYDAGAFSLVQVANLLQPGCFDEAVEGVQGFVHSASDLSFNPDPNVICRTAVQGTLEALQSACKASGLQAFVLTSSMKAVTNPKPNQVHYAIAMGPPLIPNCSEPSRAWMVYAASKVQSEQAAWAFIREHNPSFTFNAILPNVNFGPIFDPAKQQTGDQKGSSAAWVKAVYSGDFDWVKSIKPQQYIHVTDTAKLHVIAVTDCTMTGRRILACAEPFTWNKVLSICRKARPGLPTPADLDSQDEDISMIDTKLAKGLLKERYGQLEFLSLEKGVTDVLDSFTGEAMST